MAWNEPGGNNNDPWGNQKNNGGPPDLDEVFKNLKKKVEGLFGNKGSGGNRGNGSGGSSSGFPSGKMGGIGAFVLAGLALILWAISGFFIVEPASQAVVTRFGEHTRTEGPGLHWHMPWPVETFEEVDVFTSRSVTLREQLTLTQDENLVKIGLSVQYNVKDAANYLFNVRRPDTTLEQVVESAMREAIGQADLGSILTTQVVEVAEDAEANTDEEPNKAQPTGSAGLQQTTFESVQRILDTYKIGLRITAVNLEAAQPPDQVQAAFSDVNKAREDRERIISEAEAYSNEILPRARGDAAGIIEAAEGYKTRVEQAALGESQRFLLLLEEYEKAPAVTRERIYIEAMENVLGNSSKVLIDSDQGNSLMYLPIDKLINQSGGGSNNTRTTINDVLNNPGAPSQIIDSTGTAGSRSTGRSRDRGALR